MEIQEAINIAQEELKKAVSSHTKYGSIFAVVMDSNFNHEDTLYWGNFVAGYDFYVERVYRHNGTKKDCSIRLIVTACHENGFKESIYEDKFNVSLTDKTIAKKVQKAVEFVNGLPEIDPEKIHAYAAGSSGRVVVYGYYKSCLAKGEENLDKACRVSAKIEKVISYDEYHEIYGDRPWEVAQGQDSPEKKLARELSERTGVKSIYLR